MYPSSSFNVPSRSRNMARLVMENGEGRQGDKESGRQGDKGMRKNRPLLVPLSPCPLLLLLGLRLRVVDYDLDAAVHLAPGGRAVGGDRFGFAEAADGFDAFGLDASRGQVIAHRLGAVQ